ncbi:hypothetical protein C7974DRAFT_380143 [Boeremia exigua]|uniref:uncharacterized protein n=1 Tax=Boeremia exigua TaxID=749465 RepID=UPI001E8E2058|nr:uncharacterized protein C7974DRAFT_380143 [Boeremia exigua]KAH6615291.1 hypothetical protein C7974DRAFT_380143 [Boeremia exigua]
MHVSLTHIYPALHPNRRPSAPVVPAHEARRPPATAARRAPAAGKTIRRIAAGPERYLATALLCTACVAPAPPRLWFASQATEKQTSPPTPPCYRFLPTDCAVLCASRRVASPPRTPPLVSCQPSSHSRAPAARSVGSPTRRRRAPGASSRTPTAPRHGHCDARALVLVATWSRRKRGARRPRWSHAARIAVRCVCCDVRRPDALVCACAWLRSIAGGCIASLLGSGQRRAAESGGRACSAVPEGEVGKRPFMRRRAVLVDRSCEVECASSPEVPH